MIDHMIDMHVDASYETEEKKKAATPALSAYQNYNECFRVINIFTNDKNDII